LATTKQFEATITATSATTTSDEHKLYSLPLNKIAQSISTYFTWWLFNTCVNLAWLMLEFL